MYLTALCVFSASKKRFIETVQKIKNQNLRLYSLLLPRLPKLPNLCYSNGLGNLTIWTVLMKYSLSVVLNTKAVCIIKLNS